MLVIISGSDHKWAQSLGKAVDLCDEFFIASLLDGIEDVGNGALVLDNVILQSPIAGLQFTLLDEQCLFVLAATVNFLLQLL